MNTQHIRNFSIIAHIDHGKSTLADRLLEQTQTIDSREMTAQFLDQMDLERERGITIKSQAVRMLYRDELGEEYQLNLIDTPGHVDFAYEVSRSLAACEGALLIVDASQGIQAQTLANVYLAIQHDLTLIPIVNKIDLPVAQPERVAQELVDAFGFGLDEILFASAKEGVGIERIFDAIISEIPAPKGSVDAPLRALIFDSKYDPYKGVIAYVKVVDGQASGRQRLRLMATSVTTEALEVGTFRPGLVPEPTLGTGEVGYIATGLKDVRQCRVGDTVTLDGNPANKPLPGYQPTKSMVFAGFYPAEGEEFLSLREALEKLQLNDAALVYEAESSLALGFGFRCGFLGLLHMDIVQERLEREFGLNVIATAPSVAFQVILLDGTKETVSNPSKLPPINRIAEIQEPLLDMTVISPSRYLGSIMEHLTSRRGIFRRMEYLKGIDQDSNATNPASDPRVLLEYRIPFSEILVSFYDRLKSSTQGYATVDYTFANYETAPLVKLDILVNDEPVDALSTIIHRDRAYQQGKATVERLKQVIPRQLFVVPIQASIANRVIARETIRALRKNVLAKCYGGDITRKRKLLEKQAEGKKRMRKIGRVAIPQEAFLAVLRLDD
jgi:GTP-binding protein LepA